MKISLSRIESILGHSKENQNHKKPVLRPTVLTAIDDASAVQLNVQIAKKLRDQNHEVDWVNSTTLLAWIDSKLWLTCIVKIDWHKSKKQQVAETVARARGGKTVEIHSWPEFMSWFNEATKSN